MIKHIFILLTFINFVFALDNVHLSDKYKSSLISASSNNFFQNTLLIKDYYDFGYDDFYSCTNEVNCYPIYTDYNSFLAFYIPFSPLNTFGGIYAEFSPNDYLKFKNYFTLLFPFSSPDTPLNNKIPINIFLPSNDFKISYIVNLQPIKIINPDIASYLGKSYNSLNPLITFEISKDYNYFFLFVDYSDTSIYSHSHLPITYDLKTTFGYALVVLGTPPIKTVKKYNHLLPNAIIRNKILFGNK